MKKAYLVLGSVLASGMLFAQAPTVTSQYSFAKTEKYPAKGITVVENRIENDQNRMEYYSEDFDAMSALDGTGSNWNAVLETGTANFKLTNTGHFNSPGNTFIIPDLASSTPTQWVIIDSDGDGTSYANPERAALVSPVIDLNAAGAPANVKLEFEQFFAEWGGNITDETEDSCFVGVSTDGGTTWDEVEINALVGREGRPNPELFQVNIADWVAADPTNVQIRFRWAGAWNYGWQIDNVKIVDLENDEVSASRGYLRNIYDANYQIQYHQVPLSQAHQVTLGCVTKNLGYNVANNIGINYRVLDNGGGVVNSGSTTTENLATLSAGPLGETDTIWFNTSWTPSAVGDYTIEMVVTHDATDENTSNDTIILPYYVTDYVYARESGPITGGISNFATNNDGEFKMGVMFEMFADADIYGINFTLDTAVAGDLVFTELQKFNGTDWDYVNQTGDYTIAESDFDNEVVTILPAVENALAGDLYLALYSHYGTVPDGLAPTIGASGSDFDGVLGYGVNVNSGAVTGLADPIVPKVRLNLDPALSVANVEKEVKFSVFPNPANDELNVVISSAEAGKTSIVVRDLAGKVISNQQLGTVASIQTKINTEDLASGVYLVEVMNGTSKTVKKFTKK